LLVAVEQPRVRKIKTSVPRATKTEVEAAREVKTAMNVRAEAPAMTLSKEAAANVTAATTHAKAMKTTVEVE